MKNIKDIDRINVDLLKLKPIDQQEGVYKSYQKYLNQYFQNELADPKYFNDINCPICGNYNDNNFLVFDLFKYAKCYNCQVVYNTPQLKNKYLEKMYKEGEYNNYVKKLTIPGDSIRKNTTEVRKVDQVESLINTPCKILDVGCGAGIFLKIANNRGWDCSGIEISDAGLSIADQKGITIYRETFDTFKNNNSYDCITFWGVLEHVTNPLGYLEKAYSLLKPNGLIVFEVPSADSILMQYISKYKLSPYRFIENARHLTFFTKESIKLMCKKYNFKLEFIESNGLDLQTILLYNLVENLNNIIINLQQVIDKNLLSDHYRCFLRKV